MHYLQSEDGTLEYKRAKFLLLIIINHTITYIETFSTSGNPQTWQAVLVAHTNREEEGTANVYEYGVLVKEMAAAEGK